MTRTHLILVGGFLGAGKTTLLWQAAERLMADGKRVGLITNDQAPDLVDTAWLAGHGLNVSEVAGSCFCCNFDGLLDAADQIKAAGPVDVLIAEPVGSCTDLSATILQPLKDKYRQEFTLGPLSVLADSKRLRAVLSGEGKAMHPSAAYIFKKQLEEADIILVHKADLIGPAQLDELKALLLKDFPHADIRAVSSKTGKGLDAWLAEALESRQSGLRIPEVDYDVYAEGEAVLGWLNAEVALAGTDCCIPDWRHYCYDLMRRLKEIFKARQAQIGHLKVLITTECGHYVANLTQLEGDVELRGEMTDVAPEAKLVVNARVEMDPALLEEIVRANIENVAGNCAAVEYRRVQSITPGRPVPTHRYGEVV